MRINVAALILRPDGQVLLRRTAEGSRNHAWDLPSGQLEDGETPYEALQRLLPAELGRELRLRAYFGAVDDPSSNTPGQEVSLVFCTELQPGYGELDIRRQPDSQWHAPDARLSPVSASTAFALAHAQMLTPGMATATPRTQLLQSIDVLLIAPFFPFSDAESLSIPLGLASIMSHLRSLGVATAALDCSLGSDYVDLCNYLGVMSPRIVGVQFHSDMSLDWGLLTTQHIRRVLPNCLIVAGGEAATRHQVTILDHGACDLVVREEGEDTFSELTELSLNGRDWRSIKGISYKQASGRVFENSARPYIRNLDTIPPHEIDAFRWHDYGQWTLFTSRGCPFKCSFCSSAPFWRNTIRYQSPRRVVDDIHRLVERYGAQDIYIADDTFTLSRERTIEICRLITGEGLAIRWSCLTRADYVDPDLLNQMSNAGCVLISFGMESGNQNTLDTLSKRLQINRLRAALDACRTVDIRTRVSVIFGLPGEDRSSLEDTLSFLKNTQPNEIQIYGLTPHEGTVMFDNIEEYGVRILESNRMLWSRNVLNPICETDLLRRSTIIEMAERFISELCGIGYTYLSNDLAQRKIGATKTVATSFSPVQSIGGVSYSAASEQRYP